MSCTSPNVGFSPGRVVRENGRPQGAAPYPMGVVFPCVDLSAGGMLHYDRRVGGTRSVSNIEGVDHGALIPRMTVEQAVDGHAQKRRELDQLEG